MRAPLPLLAALLACLLPLANVGYAQSFDAPTLDQERESFIYDLARPGRATQTVYVWGAVGRPGIWRIEPGTNLIELLSAARVPSISTEMRETRRITFLSIYRGEGSQRHKIYEAKLQDLIAEEQSTYPVLQDGDILEVEQREKQRLSFRTVAQYVGTASALTLLVLRLVRIGNN